MATFNISLPEDMRAFVEERASARGTTNSEFVQELIRKSQERMDLRTLLLQGVEALTVSLAPGQPADTKGFRPQGTSDGTGKTSA